MKRRIHLLVCLLLAGCASTQSPQVGTAPGPVHEATPSLSLGPSAVINYDGPHLAACRNPELHRGDYRSRHCGKQVSR